MMKNYGYLLLEEVSNPDNFRRCKSLRAAKRHIRNFDCPKGTKFILVSGYRYNSDIILVKRG